MLLFCPTIIQDDGRRRHTRVPSLVHPHSRHSGILSGMEETSLQGKSIGGLRPHNGCTSPGTSSSRSIPPHRKFVQISELKFLVRKSLAENDLTVLSIFVNPAQFAPHEDLATYPRTLPRDLGLLESETLSVSDPSQPGDSVTRQVSAVFLPSVSEMYPSGISQEVGMQKGTFIEVKGFSDQMEGQSRPTFFRGVATVVTKLFNAIEVHLLAILFFLFSSPKLINKLSSPRMLTSDKRIFSRRFCCDGSAGTSFLPTQSQRTFTSYPPPAILPPDWHCHLVTHISQRRHVKLRPPYIKRCRQPK